VVVLGAEFFVKDGEEFAFGGVVDVLVAGVVGQIEIGVGAQAAQQGADAGTQF
jgi:hypothetical protein